MRYYRRDRWHQFVLATNHQMDCGVGHHSLHHKHSDWLYSLLSQILSGQYWLYHCGGLVRIQVGVIVTIDRWNLLWRHRHTNIVFHIQRTTSTDNDVLLRISIHINNVYLFVICRVGMLYHTSADTCIQINHLDFRFSNQKKKF